MYKPDTQKECLSNNIKLFCQANNLTYRDFETIIGVSESTLHNWLTLKSLPDPKAQNALEKVFDAKFTKICSNTVSIRFLIDHTYTIEDIFPYNCIIAASFGYSAGTTAMLNYEESDDAELDLSYRNVTPADFDKIFRNLSYREQTVVEMRYRDSMTLDEVGKKVGVTRERVRQLEFKALRKINRDVIRLIRDERPEIAQLQKENAELRQYIAELQRISSQASGLKAPETVKPLLLDTVVEEFDFSVRTYNCLKRAQLNTLGDIVNYTERFDHIRNLGKRSLEEIITTVEKASPAYKYDYDKHQFVLENAAKLPNYNKEI